MTVNGRESKVRTPEDGSGSDFAADRKYDDISADHGTMHDADVAVELANRNTSFNSGIGVDWSKMNNAGSRCEHMTGRRGSVDNPERREIVELVRLRDPELI